MFKLKCEVYEIGQLSQISEKFKKQLLIGFIKNEQNEKFSDYIPFEAAQDKCDLLKKIKTGDEVEVSFFVNGRKWEKNGETKFFSSLNIISIDVMDNKGRKIEVSHEMDDVKNLTPLDKIMNEPIDDGADDLPW